MSKVEKTLKKMRSNPRGDYTIEHLKAIAERYGVVFRHNGTSHAVFRTPNGDQLTVPARKPIKAVYIPKFVELIDSVCAEKE